MKNLLNAIAAIVLLNLLVQCTSNRETQLQVNHELYLCDTIAVLSKYDTTTEIFNYNERGQLVQSRWYIQHNGKVQLGCQSDITYDAYGHIAERNSQWNNFDTIQVKSRYQNDSIVESDSGRYHCTWEYDDQMRLTRYVEEFLHDKKVTRYDTLRREISWTLYKDQKPYLSIASCYSASGNLARKVYFGRKDNQWLAIKEESYTYDSDGNEIAGISSCRRGTEVSCCIADFVNGDCSEDWFVEISDSTDIHTPWERCCYRLPYHKEEKETNINGQDSIVAIYWNDQDGKQPQWMDKYFYDNQNRLILRIGYYYVENEWKENSREEWKYDEAGNNIQITEFEWSYISMRTNVTETRKHWIPNPAMKEKKR